MTTILAEAATGLQNIYTPFTPRQHLFFCIFGTAIYLIQYYRNGGVHNLLLMFGIDLTYLTQTSICSTGSSIGVLGVAEVVLLVLAGVFSYRYNKQLKAKKAVAEGSANAEQISEAEELRRETIEKEAAEREEDIVNNAFDSDGD